MEKFPAKEYIGDWVLSERTPGRIVLYITLFLKYLRAIDIRNMLQPLLEILGTQRIVLASGSPRRHEILKKIVSTSTKCIL